MITGLWPVLCEIWTWQCCSLLMNSSQDFCSNFWSHQEEDPLPTSILPCFTHEVVHYGLHALLWHSNPSSVPQVSGECRKARKETESLWKFMSILQVTLKSPEVCFYLYLCIWAASWIGILIYSMFFFMTGDGQVVYCCQRVFATRRFSNSDTLQMHTNQLLTFH